MFTSLSRIGTTPVKLIFDIEIKKLTLPEMRGIKEGDLICVSFERGSKAKSTSEQELMEDPDADGEFIIEFNETISLGVTLYRNSHDEMLKKTGTLSVKQRKKGAAGRKDTPDAFRTIGGITLALHEMAELQDEEFEEPLQWCMAEDTLLSYVVTVKDNFDDEESVASTSASVNGHSKVAKTIAAADAKQKAIAGKKDKKDTTKGKGKENKRGRDQDSEEEPDEGSHDEEPATEDDDLLEPHESDDGSDHQSHQISNSKKSFALSTPDKVVSSPSNSSVNAGKKPDSKGSNSPTSKYAASPAESITEIELSKKGLEWKEALDNLLAQNHALQEQHDAMLIMAEKADVVCEDAVKLENELKQTWQQIDEKKLKISEMEAYLHNKVADVEGHVQDLIAMKMHAVDLATELENTRHEVARQRVRHGKFVAKLETFEPPAPVRPPVVADPPTSSSAGTRQPGGRRVDAVSGETRADRSSSVNRSTAAAAGATDNRGGRDRVAPMGRNQYRVDAGDAAAPAQSGIVPVKRSRRPETRHSSARTSND